MGFVEGLQAGANLSLNRDRLSLAHQEENRAEKQQRLTALAQGYTQDENGQWVTTHLKQSENNVNQEKLNLVQQQLEATQQELQKQQSYQFAKSMANLTNSWVDGNFEDAYKYAHQTPGFLDKLKSAPSLDFQDFTQINFSNPEDIQNLKELGIDTTKIEDNKDSQDALQSSLMKVIGKDGKSRIVPIDSIIKQTNSYEFYTKEQRDKYDSNLGFINNTIKGLTIQEQEAKKGKDKLTIASIQKQAEDMTKYFKENPDKTYTDYLNSQKPSNLNDVQAKEFLDWKKLPGNENKTYSEYNNLGKDTRTKITSANLKDEYANLRVLESEGKLDKPSSVRLKVLHELFSTDNDEKRDILKTGMVIVDKYYGEGKLFNQDISKEDIINTKLYAQQSGIKPDSKSNQDLKDQFITLKIGKRLASEVSELKDDEISRGIIDTGIQKVSKLLGDETFKKLSDEDKAKVLKSIEMKTKLGKFLAKYINGISGTAVAEQEYARLSELFSGSNLENTEALKQGVKTFVSELDKEFRNTAKTSLLDNPSTTLDLVSKYKKLGFKEPEQIKEPDQQSNNEPKKGDIVQGYKFLGGNPADQNSWEQVQGAN